MDKDLTISWGLVAIVAVAGALFSGGLLAAVLAVTAAFAGFKAITAAANSSTTSKEAGPLLATAAQPAVPVIAHSQPEPEPSLSAGTQWRDRVTPKKADAPSIEFSNR